MCGFAGEIEFGDDGPVVGLAVGAGDRLVADDRGIGS
jgi:hypothetical protein